MKKWFRKIHLWLSVPFGILITLICLSGALLVYEQEITEWCRPDLYFVQTVKEAPLPMEELMERVDATLPEGSLITGVTVSPDAKRTYQVSLSQPRRASLYVDPYTGEVKGQNERLPFFSDMFRLHRWLMGSVQSAGGGISVGKLLVGLSTLMMVIILITGLLMWLTNRKKPLTKSLTISFTKGWPRFWHDLHVAGGIYATILLLAMALTGLTWSFGWYRTGFYSLFGVEASAGGGHGQGGGNSNGQGNHSKGDQANGASRQGRGGHRPHHSPYAHWQEVYETLAESHPGYRQITLGAGTASVVPEGRNSLRAVDSYTFDARSGKLTDYPMRINLVPQSCTAGSIPGMWAAGADPSPACSASSQRWSEPPFRSPAIIFGCTGCSGGRLGQKARNDTTNSYRRFDAAFESETQRHLFPERG